MESTPNIEKILSVLESYPWTKGKALNEENGVRKCDTISMLLLRTGVSEQEVSKLGMANTWPRFGSLLNNEYGLRDVVDYYLILIAGDSSVSAKDMLNRVKGVLNGDLNAIAPFYREWIASLVANRTKINADLEQAMKKNTEAGSQQFSAKFRDLRWQKRRIEILERDGERCQGMEDDGRQCQITLNEQQLEIHHRNRTTTDHWDEPSENLIALCNKHHEQESNAALSQAASKVSAALKKSNWMVRHRELLARCIAEKIVSPEEFFRMIEARIRNTAVS